VDFMRDYYEWKIVDHGVDPKSLGEETKWNYVLLDARGGVAKCVDRTNPNKQWDWYTVGGRWSGAFLLGNGTATDSAKISDLDFDAMKEKTRREALQTWGKVIVALNAAGLQRPDCITWKEFLDRDNLDIEEKRKQYHAQPFVKALRNCDATKWMSADPFVKGKAAYVEEQMKYSFSSYACLVDGKWNAKGEMGWFGCSFDENDDWQEQFLKIVEAKKESSWITNVDCHI